MGTLLGRRIKNAGNGDIGDYALLYFFRSKHPTSPRLATQEAHNAKGVIDLTPRCTSVLNEKKRSIIS